jgi:hypothetical protein
VYDERFAREYGPWRSVVGQVAEKFLACGILEHEFARIRRDDCAHAYSLAFSCKCRYFCPSCHAKRLAIRAEWLDTSLLAPVPHRQVVLTIPKRLRAYCLYRRRLLGEIAREGPRRSRGVGSPSRLPRRDDRHLDPQRPVAHRADAEQRPEPHPSPDPEDNRRGPGADPHQRQQRGNAASARPQLRARRH